jgi:hypothetical protein
MEDKSPQINGVSGKFDANVFSQFSSISAKDLLLPIFELVF